MRRKKEDKRISQEPQATAHWNDFKTRLGRIGSTRRKAHTRHEFMACCRPLYMPLCKFDYPSRGVNARLLVISLSRQ